MAEGPHKLDRITSVGTVDLHPTSDEHAVDRKVIEADIDHHMNGYQRALWRSEQQLTDTLEILDAHWRAIRKHGHAQDLALVALRAAAMTAMARWCKAAALARRESRGIHVRMDAPALDPEGNVRVLTGGLDEVWTRSALHRSLI